MKRCNDGFDNALDGLFDYAAQETDEELSDR